MSDQLLPALRPERAKTRNERTKMQELPCATTGTHTQLVLQAHSGQSSQFTIDAAIHQIYYLPQTGRVNAQLNKYMIVLRPIVTDSLLPLRGPEVTQDKGSAIT